MDALVAVRARIARALLADAHSSPLVLGAITLRPHQREAVHRLRHAIAVYGGALLADEPGMGKTFVALAVGSDAQAPIVVGPATLRTQWLAAATRAGVRIRWVSLETLSRRDVALDGDLLIIDEAHHLRSPSAARYARAARLAVGKRVLLLSATPVHNRADDRTALLALFLGAAAATLAARALGDLIVRRRAPIELLPRRLATRRLASWAGPQVAAELLALPPPFPAADGREAAALLRLTLAHGWSSSLAALDTSLRRATLVASAMRDALAEGRRPSRRELRAWQVGDGASQLAFPLLAVARTTTDAADALRAIDRHATAVADLRARIHPDVRADAAHRAAQLGAVLDAHPQQTILAFSRYAATIEALWRELRGTPAVVALTSRGVRAAGTGVTREDVLAALRADRADNHPRLPLRLVLCTEMLSEGLDLRAVSVIVHLDQPWTIARIEQREGRARRLGSAHRAITVYQCSAPRGALRLLALDARLRRKRAAMQIALSEGDLREQVQTLVAPWRAAQVGRARIAAAKAPHPGFIAVVAGARATARVLCSDGASVTEDLGALAHCLRAADGTAAPVNAAHLAAARNAVRQWCARERSAEAVQAHDLAAPSSAQRAVLRRLDQLLIAVPAHRRSAVTARVSAARHTVVTMRGAGAERLLEDLARRYRDETLLAAVEQAVHTGRPTGTVRAYRVDALLLFEPAERENPRDAARVS